MNVAELLVRCLENEGVKHVFGIPGEETLALNAALAESDKISFILTRHEQGAAFMADVYGRLSSYPGVCLSTLGPGATNLLTGVADAQLDRAPLVAITGQAGLERTHKEPHQYIDVVQMFAPVTKWSTRISLGEATPQVVRDAHVRGQVRDRPVQSAVPRTRRPSARGGRAREHPTARPGGPGGRDRLRPRRVGALALESQARQGGHPRRQHRGRARRPLPSFHRGRR